MFTIESNYEIINLCIKLQDWEKFIQISLKTLVSHNIVMYLHLKLL